MSRASSRCSRARAMRCARSASSCPFPDRGPHTASWARTPVQAMSRRMTRTMRVNDERSHLPVQRELSLTEVVSHVLDRGAVISGDVMISVAGIDLVYLGLQVVLTSVETARERGQRLTADPYE